MTQLTLSEAMKLLKVEESELPKEEQDFFLKATNRMLAEHGEEWMVQHREYLKDSLQAALDLS